MFSLTRKTDYALVALARLAEQAAADGRPLSARQIADELGMPHQVLMTVLKQLHRGGILFSRQGAHGGYFLAMPPNRIRLTDVIDVIEGPARMMLCCDEHAGEDECGCDITRKCPITSSIRRLNEQLNGILNRITLSDLMDRGIDVPLFDVRTDSRGSAATQTADTH